MITQDDLPMMDYGLSVFYNNGKNYTLVGDGIVREYPVGGLICEYCRLVPTELKDIILDCPGLDLEANPDTLLKALMAFQEKLFSKYDPVIRVMVLVEFITTVSEWFQAIRQGDEDKYIATFRHDESNAIQEYIFKDTPYTRAGKETVLQMLLSAYLHFADMDTFRSDVKALLGQTTDPKPTEPTTPAIPTTGAIELGSKVKFKASSEKYNPTTKAIPAWVKDDYYHIVTQTTVSGKPVVKGGKTCVLLGKKVKKSTGETQSGINTWVALDNLELVESAPAEAPAYRVHTVVKGDTLWDLAKKYLGDGSRYPEIKALNGLTSNVIYSGQKLKIPN